MSYVKHHTIIVTDWNESRLKECHEKAKEIFGKKDHGMFGLDASKSISDIIHGTSNGQVSFFVAPDGSKEGWDTSDEMDKRRKEFTDWMKTKSGVDFVEIIFGGDDEGKDIVTSNDDYEEEAF